MKKMKAFFCSKEKLKENWKRIEVWMLKKRTIQTGIMLSFLMLESWKNDDGLFFHLPSWPRTVNVLMATVVGSWSMPTRSDGLLRSPRWVDDDEHKTSESTPLSSALPDSLSVYLGDVRLQAYLLYHVLNVSGYVDKY